MAVPDSPVQSHWLNRYGIDVRTVIAIAVVWTAGVLCFYHSSSGDYLDEKLAIPLNFHTRDILGQTPKQDERLKILAFDDRSFASIGSPSLPLELWGDLLDGIAESKPKAIFVDAMLSAKPDETTAKLTFYFSRLKELGVPVILGSFVNQKEVAFKTPLAMDESWYQLSSYLQSNDAGTKPRWTLSKDRSGWHAYGPSEQLRPWFKHVGHFQLFDEHKVEPFLYLGEGRVLPHISMFAADKVEIGDGNVVINDHRVALDRSGAIDINFIPPNRLKIKSMIESLNDVKAGYKPSGIAEGDIVLILPLYFTGNTDFRPSPYGLIPGGQILAGMLNSVLSGKWLQPVLAVEALVACGVVALAVGSFVFNTAGFWLALLFVEMTLFVSAQLAFAYFGLVIPWLIPCLSWAGFSIHLFVLKMKFSERKVSILKSALDGAVDPVQLQRILQKPEDINLEARERVVTLMFIDVVGFSLSAENMLPRLAFETLKEILMEMGGVVHEHGGVVDKTLGDGLLCYFGYRFDTDETTTDHAEKALRCAIRIQNLNMQRNLQSLASGEPLYPLRIGINTASSYLGDLGSGQRIEFTVVGNGVNFAKRLEGACEMFSILIGSTTWELIKGLEISKDSISRRLIRIKHHKELIDAYEYDPLFDQKDVRSRVAEAFRKSANLQRWNERNQVNDPNALLVTCKQGSAIVINFSGTGISLQFKVPLTRGSLVHFSLESRAPGLCQGLANLGVAQIEAEVRWNYQSAGGFIHGLMFKNIREEHREEFVRLLSEYAYAGHHVVGGAHEAS